MEEKDREIWIGENRLYLGEDNILYITGDGNVDESLARACKEAVLKLIGLAEGKVNLFIDINKAGRQSTKTREIWAELNNHEKVKKVALYGLHPVARLIASFVQGISKKSDYRFFKTKEEALAWLKE